MTPEEARANAARRAAEARAKEPVRTPEQGPSLPPEGMFMNPETGQMTSRELMENALPTSRAGAAGSGYIQGFSLDTVDEAIGATQGEFQQEKARAQMAANARDFPVTETVGRVVGAVTSPINKVLGPVSTVRKGAAVGGLYGGIEGFNSGEGGVTERLEKAGWRAATGTLFAGLTSALGKATHGAVKKAFSRADKRPSMESLYSAKNAAYAAVRKANVKFEPDDMLALWQRVERKGRTVRWEVDPEFDKAATSMMKSLERRSGSEMSLNNLDRLRQRAWDFYARSDEPFLLEIIGEIDETIARKADGNDLISAARAANSKFSKAQMLEDAFRKARRQTAATGSGGNILNKYRQAIVSILENPKKSKWFNQEELALMDSFVMGDNAENALRKVGKLSPGGNGLMTALNVYAAAVDPTMLAVTGVATLAKEGADTSAMRGAGTLQDAVATGIVQAPKPGPNLKPLAVGGAAYGNQ